MKRIFLCLYFLLTLAAGLQAENLAEAKERLLKAYEIKKEPIAVRPLIWEILDGTEAE